MPNELKDRTKEYVAMAANKLQTAQTVLAAANSVALLRSARQWLKLANEQIEAAIEVERP